jgi:hypothetical protein
VNSTKKAGITLRKISGDIMMIQGILIDMMFVKWNDLTLGILGACLVVLGAIFHEVEFGEA